MRLPGMIACSVVRDGIIVAPTRATPRRAADISRTGARELQPLSYEHLRDFVVAYKSENRHTRAELERFRRFTYDEIVAKDNATLDISWLRDESLEDVENLPPPAVIAAEIVEDLEAALAEFSLIIETLGLPAESDQE